MVDINTQLPDLKKYTGTDETGKNLQRPENKNDIKSAIAEITTAAKNGDSLWGCIGAIKSVSKYLGHDSEIVRNIAANVIVCLIAQTVDFLRKETNPLAIKEAGSILLEVIKELGNMNNSGEIALGKGVKNDLEQACKDIIAILMCRSPIEKQGLSKNSDQDEFISSLDKAKETLTGGVTSDQFVSTLNKSMNTLIG